MGYFAAPFNLIQRSQHYEYRIFLVLYKSSEVATATKGTPRTSTTDPPTPDSISRLLSPPTMTKKLLRLQNRAGTGTVQEAGSGPTGGNDWESLLVTRPSSRLKTHVVPAAHGYAFEVKRSSHFRIVDLEGQQVVDFMAWALPYSHRATTTTQRDGEHFSASYTRYALGGLAPPQVGEWLWTNRDRKMFTLMADTVKTHDLLFMACNPGFYSRQGEPDHRSCATNFAEAMKPWGMRHWSEVIDPFNVFQNTPYYTLKALNCSKPGDYVEMRAEMDTICAVSSCPYTGGGFNGGEVTPVAVVTEVVEDEDEDEAIE